MTQGSGRPLRVAVLSDYAVVAAGVAAMLAPFADRVEVVGRVATAAEVTDVDLVLYDTFGTVRHPVSEVSAAVGGRGARLVVFSWIRDAGLVRECLEAGAAGFLLKSVAPIELVTGLERIHRGATVVPGALGPTPVLHRGTWPGIEHGLTAREAEVVALIARGLSNNEIADRTFLSVNSVKTYIRTAYRKMGVSTRAQAVLWGVRHGLNPPVSAPGPV